MSSACLSCAAAGDGLSLPGRLKLKRRMSSSHNGDDVALEAEEYQQALDFLKKPEFEFKTSAGRLSLKRIWVPVYFVTLGILLFILFLILTSPLPITRQKLIFVSALAAISAFFVAPLAATSAVPIMRYMQGERIDQPNYKDRIIHDLANAKGLRRILNGNEKLKVLGAHVKRDADKTSDRSNFLSQVLLLSGVFLAGVMLAVGDPDRDAMVTAITTFAAGITFLARGFAVMRLSTLRDWISVIEQAQNVEVEEISQTGGQLSPPKLGQVPVLEGKSAPDIRETTHGTPRKTRVRADKKG